MSKQRVYTDAAGEPPEGTWSNCLVVDRHVYIAGMTARSSEFNTIVGDNTFEQSRVIVDKIKALIEAAGGSMADIVKVNIFLTDINDRQQVWEARREYFTGDFPVSTLLEVSKLVHPDMSVEIEAVGYLGASDE